MLSELGRRPVISGNEGSFGDDFEKEMAMMVREQRRQEADDREKELNLYRSGSAPPTVEGSLSAVGGLFPPGTLADPSSDGTVTDEEYRSDPAYVSYYFLNSHLNPRLPPPLLSREDWRFAQKLQGGSSVLGGIGDRRKVSRPENGGSQGRSRASMPPGFDLGKEREAQSDNRGGGAEWDSDGLIGLPGLGLGSKQKSLAEIFQNDLGHSTPVPGHPSRPVSRNTFDGNVENLGLAEAELSHMRLELNSTEALRSTVPNVSQSASYSYAAVLGASLSRSTTPDPQLIARAPSPSLTPIGGGRAVASDKRAVNSPNTYNGVSSSTNESADLAVALSGMNMSTNGGIDEEDVEIHPNYLFNRQDSQNQDHMKNHSQVNLPAKVLYSDLGKNNGFGSDLRDSSPNHTAAPSGNSFLKRSSMSMNNGGGALHSQYQQVDHSNSSFQNYGLSGYNMNPALASTMTNNIGSGNLPPLFENLAAASAMAVPGIDPTGQYINPAASESQTLSRMGNHLVGGALQGSFVDPMYLQYMRTAEYGAALNDPSIERNCLGNSYMDLLGLQKAYLGSFLSPQKSHYGSPLGNKSSGSNHHGFYGSPPYGVGMSYLGSPLASSILPNSLVGPGSPIRLNEFNMRLPSSMRNFGGGVVGPWHLDGSCNVDESFASSLLEEFKSNKAKCFELSEIAGHVVEFSTDQYGSRFIQQKLETATMEEKNMIFKEIMPQALSLMTDVFGNYVVQKFFEHGAASQRRELAKKLSGHVLTLSLQMYGCRVIQKAIEVVDVDQKISMVEELDGNVMRCVRDQNGNHVIQKCIECVPEEAIPFIVTTFFDQVVTLSTHPYGCRVVQRILEHCKDPKTQDIIMDEILGSVSMLAQDQYGNYVIQHVLEHGKSHERSAIIEELAGKIVQMSQQKFASNVVEKCLTFGGPSEREILVNEMLGSTDENEPLQAMMKDQFANYVVQKVLETCDDEQRGLILSRIKVHLNALKKYTYGKHIVARVEKLIAAGERRIAIQAAHLA